MPKNLTPQLIEEFLQEARLRISNEPHDRLSEKTKIALKQNNFVFDAHCHVFDGQCIDPKYFIVRALGATDKPLLKFLLEKLVNKVLKEKAYQSSDELIENIYEKGVIEYEMDIKDFFEKVSKEVERELGSRKKLGENKERLLKRIKEVIEILKSNSMEAIYKKFHDNYSIRNVDVHKGKTLITVLLGMDIEPGWQDEKEKENQKSNIVKKYKDQARELGELAKSFPVLPFLPIDPRRFENKEGKTFNELWDTFLDAFDKDKPSFYGIKLYPSLGYLPSDERIQPILQICAEKGIPVTAHCGGEMVSTFKKSIEVNRFGVKATISEKSRKLNSRKLNEPTEWIKVLEENPKLHLNLGHFGGVDAWKTKNHATSHRIKTIIGMMNNSTGKVFTDFSFNLNDKKASVNFIKVLNSNNDQERIVKKRCMFGTDFWVVLPMSDIKKDQAYFSEITTGSHYAIFKDNVLDYLGIRVNEL